MLKQIALILLCGVLTVGISAQELISYSLIGSKSKTEIADQFNFPLIQYGARYYKITYTTPDLDGLQDTVSGLVVVPDDANKIYPRLLYQHGTSSSKDNVPSNYGQPEGGEGDIALFFAGMGFFSAAPDYLGLGVSEGFHPYVHAESESWVALDMLRALDSLESQINTFTNDQLFVTGYSQGGHASMALHRSLETDPVVEFEATAAAHLSGPYSIGEVMRDLILSDSVYFYPAYVPNTVLSYQVVYGNLFDEIEDVFRQPYAGFVENYFTEQINLGELNQLLIDELILNEGDCIPTRMLKDSIIQEVTANPDHPMNIALRDNNVYQWAPQVPTRLFYCKADDQVPYLNSLLARDTMLTLGAADLAAADQDSTANHVDCVEPALTATLFFFIPFQQIDEVSIAGETPLPRPASFNLQPNPASDFVQLNFQTKGELQVYDINGRLIHQRAVGDGPLEISVGSWQEGQYLFALRHQQGMDVQIVLVQH